SLRGLAFTADGRALAWGDGDTASVTAIATGKALRRFGERPGEAMDVAITSDGSLLVSLSNDGSATVWRLAGLDKELRPRPALRKAEELDGLWKDLADEDATKAYEAIWSLTSSPGQAVALVKDRVLAAGGLTKADAEQFARLLADLDADKYERR